MSDQDSHQEDSHTGRHSRAHFLLSIRILEVARPLKRRSCAESDKFLRKTFENHRSNWFRTPGGPDIETRRAIVASDIPEGSAIRSPHARYGVRPVTVTANVLFVTSARSFRRTMPTESNRGKSSRDCFDHEEGTRQSSQCRRPTQSPFCRHGSFRNKTPYPFISTEQMLCFDCSTGYSKLCFGLATQLSHML